MIHEVLPPLLQSVLDHIFIVSSIVIFVIWHEGLGDHRRCLSGHHQVGWGGQELAMTMSVELDMYHRKMILCDK